MIIITKIDDNVNTVKSKWDDKKRLAMQISAKLIKCGHTKRGYLMSECANQLIFRHCTDCGHVSVHRASLCRDKLCPVCNWRLARQRYGGMRRILEHIAQQDTDQKYQYLLMTLTVPNVPVHMLGACISWMSEAWNRLMQRKSCNKQNIIGWARAVEITYNNTANTLHPHYHVIIITPQVNSQEWRQKVIADWCECYKGYGNPSINAQDIREIYSRDIMQDNPHIVALLETFKYTQKSSDLLNMPGRTIYEYANQIKGRRMIAYGGIIKAVKDKLKIADMDVVQDDDDTTDKCAYCGSHEVHDLLCQWCGVSYEPIL